MFQQLFFCKISLTFSLALYPTWYFCFIMMNQSDWAGKQVRAFFISLIDIVISNLKHNMPIVNLGIKCNCIVCMIMNWDVVSLTS